MSDEFEPAEPSAPPDGLRVGLAAGLAARRDALALAACALVAVGTSWGLASLTDTHTARAAARLGQALELPVTIGGADVDLSGAMRLERVQVGTLFAAAHLEAGLGLTSLLAGRTDPDEIRVSGPQLELQVDAQGRSDLGRLVATVRARRQAARGGQPTTATDGGTLRLRRIVVESGALHVGLADLGDLTADRVELVPGEHGLRVITGNLRLQAAHRGLEVEASFARVGADLSPDDLRPTRAVLDGGGVRVRSEGAPAVFELRDAVLKLEDQPRKAVLSAHHEAGPLLLTYERDERGAAAVQIETARLPLAAFAAVAPAWARVETASLAGRIALRPDGDALAIVAAVDVDGLTLSHPLLAQQPVPVSGHFEQAVERSPRGLRAKGEAKVGALVVRVVDAQARFADDGTPTDIDLQISVPQVSCADALAAVPAPLQGPLAGMALEGQLAGSLSAHASGAAPDKTTLDIALEHTCKAMADGPAADVAALAKGGQITLPNGQVRAFTPGAAGFVAFADLPDHVPAAFVGGEDARFFVHHGFDPEQMRLSLAANVASGKVERGGSTISQQIAKNLFLSRERTLTRKLLEAVLTWRLESTLGKERLLELYLNIIELGPGIYGLGPASEAWFGVPASKLDVAQAAFLAALTPAPMSLSRRIAAAKGLDDVVRERVQIILRSMKRNHLISDALYQRGKRTSLEVRPQPVPTP